MIARGKMNRSISYAIIFALIIIFSGKISWAVPVDSIKRQNTSPTNVDSVVWTVSFTDTVTGLTSDNFELVANGPVSLDSAVMTVSGADTLWTVEVHPVGGDGTLGLNMTDDTGVEPAFLNLPIIGEEYTIDNSLPEVAISEPDPDDLILGPAAYILRGTASDVGVGVAKVEVKITDGGNTVVDWTDATGTASWTYNWILQTNGENYVIYARSTDYAGNVSSSDSVPVSVDKHKPVAISQTNVQAKEYKDKVILLTGSDADPEDLVSERTYKIVSLPTNGVLFKGGQPVVNLNATYYDGTFTYRSYKNYTGFDSFSFTVNDGYIDSNPSGVGIQVSAASQALQAYFISRINDVPYEFPYGSKPLTVVFDARGSSGPNPISNYAWNFGDGSTANGQVVSHTFVNTKSYYVDLTITDSAANTATMRRIVSVADMIHYVKTATEFQAALDTAKNNGKHDIIRLAGGVYGPSSHFDYTSAVGEHYDLVVEGGWTEDFTLRAYNVPTILDGSDIPETQGDGGVLSLSLGAGFPMTSFGVDGVTIMGAASSGAGGGAYVRALKDIVFSNNIVVDNTGGTEGGGAYLESTGGTVWAYNNLIENNDAGSAGGGLYANSFGIDGGVYLYTNVVRGNTAPASAGIYAQTPYGSDFFATNNTVYDNDSGGLSAGGGSYQSFMGIQNNILYGNAPGSDLFIDTACIDIQNNIGLSIINNDFATFSMRETCSSYLLDPTNINVAPSFLIPGTDYRLASSDALLIDKGITGFVPERDLEGDGIPYVSPGGDSSDQAIVPDIGADEYNPDNPGGPSLITLNCINNDPESDPSYPCRIKKSEGSVSLEVLLDNPVKKDTVLYITKIDTNADSQGSPVVSLSPPAYLFIPRGGQGGQIAVTAMTGERHGTSDITAADPSGKLIQGNSTIELAVDPKIGIAPPASWDFGSHKHTSPAVTKDFIVSNTGTYQLAIQSIAPSGTGYDISNNTCTGTLLAGATCTVTVRFTPGVPVGQHGGTLTIVSDTGGVPNTSSTVNLAATVTAGQISVSPAVLNFGDQSVGTESTPQTVTVSNNGNEELVLNSISPGGTNSSEFILNKSGGASPCGNTPVTIAAGASCTAQVSFKPTGTASGLRSALVSITSDDPDPADQTKTVALNGNAILPALTVACSSNNVINGATLNFGSLSIPAGEPVEKICTVTNNGAGDLAIGTVSGPSSGGDFQLQSDGCSGQTIKQIDPGCTFRIQFVPKHRASALAGQISVPSNDPRYAPGNFAINLSGSGVTSRVAVFRNGMWIYDYNGSNRWDGVSLDFMMTFGQAGDVPVFGYWDGQMALCAGVYRAGKWYLDYNCNNRWDGSAVDRFYSFGATTDIPVAGDWNGDGKTEIGVFRGSEKKWYLDKSGDGAWNSGDASYQFGAVGDRPVVGDWNGDGKTEIGVFRGSEKKWYLDKSGDGAWSGGDVSYSFGATTDIPVAGDWNGDGKTEIGVFRTGKWYLDTNGNGAWNTGIDLDYSFGQTDDLPLIYDFDPSTIMINSFGPKTGVAGKSYDGCTRVSGGVYNYTIELTDINNNPLSGITATKDQKTGVVDLTSNALSGCSYEIKVNATDRYNRQQTSTLALAIAQPLTVTKAGTGSGTVTGTGISCGPNCNAQYECGTTVTLTAAPDANSVFAGWAGASCAGTAGCTATMDGIKNVTATFNRKEITVGNGTDPAGTNLVPGGPATMLDAFTLKTSGGNDTVTGLTVTLATGTSAGLSKVEITNDAGTTVYGSVTNLTGDSVPITLTTNISVTSTSVQYKVRITPKSHAAMPQPPAATYPVTGRVTALVSTYEKKYEDTGSSTVTIDNQSPGNAVWGAVSTAIGQLTLNWTNPGDADFSQVVILRKTSSIGDVPVEGATYSQGNMIGASTVRYAGNLQTFVDTGLTNGTTYYYKVFTKDSSGNYSTGVQTGPHTPGAPDTTPPVTTAYPPGGTYTSAQNVTLSCSDNSSGCAAIYYCTGTGCSPVTSYTGPISISTSTVLNYYSRDNEGNVETTETATYTIGSSSSISYKEVKLSMLSPGVYRADVLFEEIGTKPAQKFYKVVVPPECKISIQLSVSGVISANGYSNVNALYSGVPNTNTSTALEIYSEMLQYWVDNSIQGNLGRVSPIDGNTYWYKFTNDPETEILDLNAPLKSVYYMQVVNESQAGKFHVRVGCY